MGKSKSWLIAFVVVSLLAIFTVYEFGVFDVELAPKPAYSRCITPPAYPQMIMQSGTICPGTYNYGIGIGADNVNVKCIRNSGNSPSSVRFNGANWNGTHGLLINGSWRNITIEDCDFIRFSENGVLLKGPNSALNSPPLTGVVLKKITATGSGEDGLRIRENTYQVDVIGGNYDTNVKNGIHLLSEYKDPARWVGPNPDSNIKYFPNDVRIFNATMSGNWNNGIHVDAEKYYRQPDDMALENNVIILVGNHINNNRENGLKNTDFFVNVSHSGYSQASNYFVGYNRIFNNSLAGIKINTQKTQGPNGNEINNSIPFPAPSNQIIRSRIAISSISYIYWNILEENKNGIEQTIDSVSTPNSLSPGYSSGVNLVFANRIRNNRESGVLYSLKDPSSVNGPDSDFNTLIENGVGTPWLGLRYGYYQNIISSNGNSGAFLNGSSSSFGNNVGRLSWISLYCNDIINNRDYGVRLTGRDGTIFSEDSILPEIHDYNIIEQNTIGGVYSNFSTPNLYFLHAEGNHLANHPVFDIYNGVVNASSAAIAYNDFASSPLLAFDAGSLLWRRNWWSDYSPTCVNANNDEWCDVNRFIPVANQDVQPKAGLAWGRNGRGYLPLDQGIMLSQCYIPQIPNYPGRPGGTGRGKIPPWNP